MKNLFDRLDVLGEDVKQKYIANLTTCNVPHMVELGYAEWMLFDTEKDHSMSGGFVYDNSPEGHDFWLAQQAQFDLLNNVEYAN